MRLAVLAGLLLGGGFLFLPSTATGQTPTRLRGRIDPSLVVPLSGHIHPRARPEFDQGPLNPSTPISNVILGLKLTTAQQTDLEQFIASQQNPASPNYDRWLTPDQFAARFGAAQSDIDQITAWLRSQGLSVDMVSNSRNWIAFSGTAGRLGNALHTEFHRFVDAGETHFANATEPSLPEALAPVVSGLLGLNDYHPRRAPQSLSLQPQLSSPDGSHVPGPADYAVIYDFQQLYNLGIDGTGQTIAIAGQSDVKSSDIAMFRSQFGLPAANLTTKVFGPAPPADPGSEAEADLDIEWSGAIARNASIILVYSNDAFQSLIYAIDQNLAPIANLSFGDCERYWTADALLFQNIMQQANAQGITVVIAAGDGGPASCDVWFANPIVTNGPAVSFPASIPEVTAVGGSQFSEGQRNYWSTTPNSNGAFATSYIPEAAWNETSSGGVLAAGGGGASAVFPKPAWQTGSGVPNDKARDVPDVALNASAEHDGFLLCVSGVCGVAGGTSGAAPIFAGMMALLNQYVSSQHAASGSQTPPPGLGNVNPVLYRLASGNPVPLHDITLGSNIVPCASSSPGCVNGEIGYSAAIGYDLATGLGSLDLFNLASQWSKTPSIPGLTFTVTPSAPTLNQTIQLIATLQPGGAAPTGQVTFSSQGGALFPASSGSPSLLGSSLLGTVPLQGFGAPVAALSVPASELALGSNTIVASYSGDPNYSSVTATAPVTLTLPTAGSAVVPTIDPPAVPEILEPWGPGWVFSITLTELAGKATTLTSFGLDGVDYSSLINSFFGTTAIPAHGTLTTTLAVQDVHPPQTRTFTFGGTDGDGTTWERTLNEPFLGLQQLLQVGSVNNAASGDVVYAPGMLVSVYGAQMASATVSATSLPLPAKLGGASVTVNGVTAPVWYASDGQLNVQIPYETQPGIAVLTVNNGFENTSYSFKVGASAPGIFVNAKTNAPVPYGSGNRGGTYTLFITGDGVPSPAVATGAAPQDPNNLPKPQLPVQVTIGGVSATVVFAGIPTWSAGVTQINFMVPADAPLGAQPLVVTVGTVHSLPAAFTVTR